MISTDGHPYYSPRVQFCSPKSLSRSLLQRIDSLAKSDNSSTKAKIGTCDLGAILSPREYIQLGAQISRAEYEVMLNPNFSDDTN
jgi:hypothetical protein